MPRLSVQHLFSERREKLELTWVAGQKGGTRVFPKDVLNRPGVGLVGHFNLNHPIVVQVIGASDVDYLEKLSASERGEALYTLFSGETICAIVGDDLEVPQYLSDAANRHDVALIASAKQSRPFVNLLRAWLQRELSEVSTMHGVFLDVLGIGVLIRGDSSIGKSELALELISRGAGLVADDVVEIYQIGPETLQGRCPPLLRDFLEVRGLGVLNIKLIFGETAVRPRKTLKLVVNLERPGEDYQKNLNRLAAAAGKETMLGVEIPSVTIALVVGRNLAVLVEAAVRNYILQTRGYDSSREFLERHEAAMRAEADGADPNATGVFQSYESD
ncbi:MAG: HPr kinase/phosphorylase [Betaproteobacteria bacterium]|nr:HPr kinase/phosphorylase [Betaproteobacteria bacterium]